MKYIAIICCFLIFSSPCAAQTLCPNPHDTNIDGVISITDLLDLLVIFGFTDVDYDGVWDNVDSCIDMSACNFADNPTSICLYLDAVGECGGACSGDADGDGICNDVDTCMGIIDVCGICNGSGPISSIVESISILYDSLYAPQIDKWLVFEVGADTVFTNECAVVFMNCGDAITHAGYNYSTVQIGGQCWFAENCKYLPTVAPSSAGSSISPYCYVYGYQGTDVVEAKSTPNYLNYGVLYNFPATISDGICPIGWHVPSDIEWQILEINLGMSESEASAVGWRGNGQGAQLKSTSGWNNNGNGTNYSGFWGIPGGYRSVEGVISYIGNYGFWWTSSSSSSINSWSRLLSYSISNVSRNEYDKMDGMSVRCVMD